MQHQAKNLPIVDLAELLAATSLPTHRYQETKVVYILCVGELGRWILRRATALGLEVSLSPANQYPLQGSQNPATALLLLRLAAPPEKKVPASLVYRLSQLPYTLLATPALDTEAENLLVDINHRLSLTASLITPMIPPGEKWLLGRAGVSNWRLRVTGDSTDGSLLLEAPQLPQVDATLPSSPTLPTALRVQLVSRPQTRQRVDAVLLDSQELIWLRSWLLARPLGEESFLVFGNRYHFFTAPGGFPQQLPLGIPLVWTGPHSLYLELGKDFYPPLPLAARQASFQLNPEKVVVVAQNCTYHFDLNHLAPSWSLWLGDAPPVVRGLSAQAVQILQQVIQPNIPVKPVRATTPSPEVDLLEQAQRAELGGDLVQAASLLEKGGYTGQAGRLYERIAKKR
jgi:hypothetical protein